MMIIEIILYILIIKPIFLQKLIETSFGHMRTSYDVLIQLGIPPTSIALVLNLKEPYHTFNFHRFPNQIHSSSTKLSTHIIKFNYKEIEADEYCVQFKFYENDIKIYPFYFIYINPEKEKYYDSFSLAFKFYDEKHSIIHALYKNEYISKRQFGFLNKQSFTKLIYGGLPPSETNTKFRGKCKVIEGNNITGWGCNLTEFVINRRMNNQTSSYMYFNKDQKYFYSYFQTNTREILVPTEYFHFIKYHVFRDLVNSNKCFFNSQFRLICSTSFINSVDFNVSINFEDNKFILHGKELFEEYGDTSQLIMKINDENPREWVFGVCFLKYYSLLFDYDDKSISFYSDIYEIINSNIKKENIENINLIGFWLNGINSLLLFLMSLYLGYCKYILKIIV